MNFSNKDTEVCSQRRTRFSIELLIVQYSETIPTMTSKQIISDRHLAVLIRRWNWREYLKRYSVALVFSCPFQTNRSRKNKKNTKIVSVWHSVWSAYDLVKKNDVIGWLIKTKSQLEFKMIWKMKQNLVIWLDNMSSHWLAISPDVKQTKNGPWEFIFFP